MAISYLHTDSARATSGCLSPAGEDALVERLHAWLVLRLQWYHPAVGEWQERVMIRAAENGTLLVPDFFDATHRAFTDWAAKIVAE